MYLIDHSKVFFENKNIKYKKTKDGRLTAFPNYSNYLDFEEEALQADYPPISCSRSLIGKQGVRYIYRFLLIMTKL